MPPRRPATARRSSPEPRSCSVVPHAVDADGDGEDQRGLLPSGHLDPVGVTNPEPALGDLRHLVAGALDLILVVDEIALRRQVVAAVDLDRVAVANADQRLLDGRGGVPAALDLVPVTHAELLLPNREQLLAGGTFEHERVPDPQRLSVDLEGPL